MINKQNLWFLTLFSLILILGIYYVTLHNELIEKISTENKKEIADRIISNNDTDISNLSFNDYDYLLS